MFVDRVRVWAVAGKGGPGSVSFRREKFVPMGGPDGGDGGKGGSVIIKVNPHLNHLEHIKYSPHMNAGHGEGGKGTLKSGKGGADIVVEVPPGTVITKLHTTEEDFFKSADDSDGVVVADLVEPEGTLVLCAGGKGGKGNAFFKSSVNQAPEKTTSGLPGEMGQFIFELKSIAQIGLLGFPNAGKSSVLRGLSSAKPKVSSYPFTTLSPVIGMIQYEDHLKISMADVPGIIEGAHEGHGLGLQFLKHLERCPVLAHVVDMAGSEGRNPIEDYQKIRAEIKHYRKGLSQRPTFIIANKMDIAEAWQNLEFFKTKVRKKIIPVSTLTGEGMDELKKLIRQMVEKHESRVED